MIMLDEDLIAHKLYGKTFLQLDNDQMYEVIKQDKGEQNDI